MLYFAYGSNMLHRRLAERIGGVGEPQTARLSGFRLAFNKRGRDGSGKCNLSLCSDSAVHGGVYVVAASQFELLDSFEPNYRRAEIAVELGGAVTDAWTYIAESEFVDDSLAPFDWYLQLVLEGAASLALPSSHLQHIAAFSAAEAASDRRRCFPSADL